MAQIPQQTRTRFFTAATASAGPYTVGFRLLDPSGLTVYVNGVRRTDFSVDPSTIAVFSDSATITFATPLAFGDEVIIDGNQPVARGLDYLRGDPGFVTLVNAELSRVSARLLEIDTALGRTARGLDPVDPVDGLDFNTIQNAQAAANNATAAAAIAVLNGGTGFTSRAAFITAQATALTLANGACVVAAGYGYIRDSASTALPSLPGWRPTVPAVPQHFGAVGDGVTDDSAAMQAAVNWLVAATGRALVAPQGDYLLNTAAVASVGAERFSVTGAGEGVTRFIVPATNTVGGILLSSNSRAGQVRFSDFTITRRGGGGIGLQYTSPEGGNQHRRGVVCERVTVEGENNTTDYFAQAFNFAGAWRPLVRDCRARGPFIGVTDADASPRFFSDVGINLDGCYDATVDTTHVWSAKTCITNRQFSGSITSIANQGGGIVRLTLSAPHPFSSGLGVTVSGTTNYNGTFTATNSGANTVDITAPFVSSQTGTISSTTGPEALRITDSIMVGCKNGLVHVRPNGREPIIWFTGNHVNYRDNGLRIDGAKLITMSGNHIYNQDDGNIYAGTAVDVLMQNASEFICTGNIHHYPGATDRIAYFVESDTGGEGDNGLICHNLFSGTFANAVWLSTNVTGVTVGPNVYSGTISGAVVNDISTSNTILDGKAETTGTWTPALTFGGAAVGMTYGSRSGTYRIVGGVLHYQIDIALTAKGSSVGTADISLPSVLPGVRTIQVGGDGAFAVYANMATIAGPAARATSATNLRLVNQGAVTVANMTEANFTNTSSLTITGSLLLA